MKLAEALIQRAEIKTQIENLRERLKSNAVVQEGEKPIENPTELMEMVDRKIVELENLIKSINNTNSFSKFYEKESISDVLAKRDMMLKRISILKSLISATEVETKRYSLREIKEFPTVNRNILQKTLDDVCMQYRELDVKIQQLNWQVDLL